MLIAETFPGLGGPHDVARLPYRYFRRLTGYLRHKQEVQAEAMKPKEPEDHSADWDADRIDGGPT